MVTTRSDSRPLTLQEAGRALGVHYMTVYRYVRTGRLPAHRRADSWEVDASALERFRLGRGRVGRRGRPALERRVPELLERLVAADEAGAWAIAEAALAAGASPSSVYHSLFVPAMRALGDRWERREASVADEHGATAVMQRLVGRMGPRFRRRGRPRGVVVIGAPPGELHGLPAAFAADLLRASGYAVTDLGADVPTESFAERVRRQPRVHATCVSVTTRQPHTAVRQLVRALHGTVDAPVLVGGAGISEEEAGRVGSDGWSATGDELVALVTSLRAARR